MSFRYGMYLNPQPTDKTTLELEEAKDHAHQLSLANNGAPAAVWNDKDSTVALFVGFEEFTPIKLIYG